MAARWLHLCDLMAETMTVEEAAAAMAADTLTEGTTDENIARTTETDVTMADETTTLAVVTDETATTISEGTRHFVASCLQEGRRDVMQQYSTHQRRSAAIRNQHPSLSDLQPTVKYPAAKTAASTSVFSYASFDPDVRPFSLSNRKCKRIVPAKQLHNDIRSIRRRQLSHFGNSKTGTLLDVYTSYNIQACM